MPSPKTLAFRSKPRAILVMVCAFCLARNKKNPRVGGTLHRSKIDGLLYHVEHLPERRFKANG